LAVLNRRGSNPAVALHLVGAKVIPVELVVTKEGQGKPGYRRPEPREAFVMRNLIVALVLLVVVVAGLGYYLGWFHFSTSRDPQTGQPGAQITIDQDKVKADAQKARQKVGAAGQAKGQPEEK
jgi:hypothetical protein